MATIDIGWTPSTLRDVSMALDVSLERVPEESVRQTAIAESWRKAHEWVQVVQQLSAQADGTIRLEQVPPFPLTSQELQALQASLDRIAQARAAASPTRVGTTATHVRRSFGRVMLSAYGLGLVLLGCTAITVVDVTLFQGARSPWYLGLSLGGAGVALAVWFLHFRHLGIHKAIIDETHPLP
jgi:hypothetical protein